MLESILDSAKKYMIEYEVLPYNVGRLHFKVLKIKDFVEYSSQVVNESLYKQKEYRAYVNSDDSFGDLGYMYEKELSEQ